MNDIPFLVCQVWTERHQSFYFIVESSGSITEIGIDAQEDLAHAY